jgi:hypothetical protein
MATVADMAPPTAQASLLAAVATPNRGRSGAPVGAGILAQKPVAFGDAGAALPLGAAVPLGATGALGGLGAADAEVRPRKETARTIEAMTRNNLNRFMLHLLSVGFEMRVKILTSRTC